jgi:AsmA protein
VNVALQMNRLGALRVTETLNASIDVNLNDGADKGLDAIKTICSAGRKLETLLTGETGELEQAGDTEFSAMSAKFVFVDGVATNDDFDVKSPLLRVRGSGSANLRQDTVDYLVDAELVKACDGQSGASADKLVGVPLPIREKGLFVSPKIPPD